MNLKTQQPCLGQKGWEQYEEIFDTLREPFLILSSDLRVLKANKAFYSLFQVTLADTAQHFIYDLGNRQWDIPALRHLLEEILPQTKTLENYEITHRFDVIGERTMLLNARSIEHADSILLAIEDVTERIRYQEELERSNQALSCVASIASHDLREPIRTISVYLELIGREMGGIKDKKILEYLRFTIDGAKRMTNLVNQLLSHASIGGKHERTSVDLNLIYQQAIDDLQEIILESGAKIKKSQLPVVIGGASEFSQLFQNLLSNAIKYRKTMPLEITISSEKKNRDWIISIKDNGMGIPKESSKKIFEMFTRLHSKEISGSGIGLSTCKKIAEDHGGEIWVESVLGEGSIFFLRLPAE